MPTLISPVKLWTEVAEWEEPRHSGLGWCRHSTPLCPTLQHNSPLFRPTIVVRAGPDGCFPIPERNLRGGARWEMGTPNSPVSLHQPRLSAILHPAEWDASHLANLTRAARAPLYAHERNHRPHRLRQPDRPADARRRRERVGSPLLPRPRPVAAGGLGPLLRHRQSGRSARGLLRRRAPRVRSAARPPGHALPARGLG